MNFQFPPLFFLTLSDAFVFPAFESLNAGDSAPPLPVLKTLTFLDYFDGRNTPLYGDFWLAAFASLLGAIAFQDHCQQLALLFFFLTYHIPFSLGTGSNPRKLWLLSTLSPENPDCSFYFLVLELPEYDPLFFIIVFVPPTPCWIKFQSTP